MNIDLKIKMNNEGLGDDPDDVVELKTIKRGLVDEDAYYAETNLQTASGLTLGLDNEFALDDAKRFCLVCSDLASGLHYGVASCEACKAFFKRTVQGNIEYTCMANGDCEITKRRRKACQACRYQKCLSMGMLKEGVRIDRVRGGRQKYRRVADSTGSIRDVYDGMRGPLSDTSSTSSSRSRSVVIDRSSWLEGRLLKMLADIEPEKVYAMPDGSLSDGDYKLMLTMSDLSDRELVATIGWAKQVPGFLDLPLRDQMNLLQSTWLDIHCLNLARRSYPYRRILIYADDFCLSESDSLKLGTPPEMDAVARKLCHKYSQLSISQEEYLLLKAMLLFNPDINLTEPQLVQSLRDAVHECLLEYEASCLSSQASPVGGRGASGGGGQRRVCNLLFVLPLVTHLRVLTLEYWDAVRRTGRIVLHKLLGEMLDFMSAV